MLQALKNRFHLSIRARRLSLTIVAIAAIMLGTYLLFLLYAAPHRAALPPIQQPKQLPHQSTPVVTNPDRQLVIPAIGVKADIAIDKLWMLDQGYIVQRSKAGGSPTVGGNFVLTGHRFRFDVTPQRVRQKSVLFDLDRLKPGDSIIVFWERVRYDYTVKKLYQVKPDAVVVEQPSVETKLTIYTCTLGGTYDGRLVVEASPLVHS